MSRPVTRELTITYELRRRFACVGPAILATFLLSAVELPSTGPRVAVRDFQLEEEPELPDPIIPIPENPEPKVPEPDVPEPDVPEPDVPEPSVPEPSIPEPNVPEPSVPEPDLPEPEAPEPGAQRRQARTLLSPAPQPRDNRLLQMGAARMPAMI